MKLKLLFTPLFLFLALPVFAQSELFNLSVKTDAIVLGSSAAIYGTYFICDKLLKMDKEFPSDELSSFQKSSVNKLDQLFMKPYSKKLDLAGTLIGGGAMASALVLAGTPKNDWLTVGTMYAETLFLSYSLKCLGKLIAGRARPYMYFDGYPEEAYLEGDWNDSFPSAHTTWAFAAAAFSSYVFCKYFPESSLRYAVIGGTYSLALITAALRVASGCHFVTDVLAGAFIGSACGFLVPYLHTLEISPRNEVALSLNSVGLIINF